MKGVVVLAGICFVAGAFLKPDTPADSPVAEQPAMPSDAEKQAEAEAEAEAIRIENRRKGFHCLSPWSGHSTYFEDAVKAELRDPDSFAAVDTTIGPVTPKGMHPIRMKYRAKNGFGGYNVEEAAGAVDPTSCRAQVIHSPAELKALLG